MSWIRHCACLLLLTFVALLCARADDRKGGGHKSWDLSVVNPDFQGALQGRDSKAEAIFLNDDVVAATAIDGFELPDMAAWQHRPRKRLKYIVSTLQFSDGYMIPLKTLSLTVESSLVSIGGIGNGRFLVNPNLEVRQYDSELTLVAWKRVEDVCGFTKHWSDDTAFSSRLVTSPDDVSAVVISRLLRPPESSDGSVIRVPKVAYVCWFSNKDLKPIARSERIVSSNLEERGSTIVDHGGTDRLFDPSGEKSIDLPCNKPFHLPNDLERRRIFLLGHDSYAVPCSANEVLVSRSGALKRIKVGGGSRDTYIIADGGSRPFLIVDQPRLGSEDNGYAIVHSIRLLNYESGRTCDVAEVRRLLRGPMITDRIRVSVSPNGKSICYVNGTGLYVKALPN